MASSRLSNSIGNSFDSIRISREGHPSLEINIDQVTPRTVATAFSVSMQASVKLYHSSAELKHVCQYGKIFERVLYKVLLGNFILS